MLQWVDPKPVSKDRLVNLVHSLFGDIGALDIQDPLMPMPLFKECMGWTN